MQIKTQKVQFKPPAPPKFNIANNFKRRGNTFGGLPGLPLNGSMEQKKLIQVTQAQDDHTALSMDNTSELMISNTF